MLSALRPESVLHRLSRQLSVLFGLSRCSCGQFQIDAFPPTISLHKSVTISLRSGSKTNSRRFSKVRSQLIIREAENINLRLLFPPSSDYMNSKDLHIGVTTSSGAIVEFDRHGLRRHSTKEAQRTWAQSLLVEQVPEAWFDHWDSVLGEVSHRNITRSTRGRHEIKMIIHILLSL